MEKGKISSLSKFSPNGTITDEQGQNVDFDSNSILPKDRKILKTADLVWFERSGGQAGAKAVNIRKR